MRLTLRSHLFHPCSYILFTFMMGMVQTHGLEGIEWTNNFWMQSASCKVRSDHFQVTVRSIIFFKMGSKIIHIIYFQIRYILHKTVFAVTNQFFYLVPLSSDTHYFYSCSLDLPWYFPWDLYICSCCSFDLEIYWRKSTVVWNSKNKTSLPKLTPSLQGISKKIKVHKGGEIFVL